VDGKVFKAVIPVAGLGTRMGPLARFLPKEMFPLGRTPMIQLALEEAIGAGIREICVVIREGKEIIRNYILKGTQHGSENKGKGLLRSCRLTFVYQKSWDGLGGALMVARPFVGQDPFLMVLPDQLLCSAKGSASRQLLSQYKFTFPAVLSSMVKVPKKEVEYFSSSIGFILDSKKVLPGHPVSISGVRSVAETHRFFAGLPYEIRGFARTIFPPAIFAYLGRRFANPKTGEVDLWKTFREFPKRLPHYGCLLTGRPCDLGTLPGYYRYLDLFLDI
jgi:UTP--glucose-1-phosphate uridylyltransferase